MPGRSDIALARFPFTDQGSAKLRPVLILAEVPGSYRDYLVLFISSQLHQAVAGVDIVIGPRDAAFAASGLKPVSVFRIGEAIARDHPSDGDTPSGTLSRVVALPCNLFRGHWEDRAAHFRHQCGIRSGQIGPG